MNLGLATLGLNATVDQIVYYFRIGSPRSNANTSVPILLWPPDAVVQDFNVVGVPQFNAAVQATGDEVVANNTSIALIPARQIPYCRSGC
jgi:hypothetical protein